MRGGGLRPAALAFNEIALAFDSRFSQWKSVTAQRSAVRRSLVQSWPVGARILEVGGGTGEDALWLAQQGFHVTTTDISPAMVAIADAKLAPFGFKAELAAAEELEEFADRCFSRDEEAYDGAFSNFAGLNCVEDLTPVGRALARLVRPGGTVVLVLFGIISPGEILVESLRGRPNQALRRFGRGAVPARLAGRHFPVTYHRAADLRIALHPWFELTDRRGIGIFVPPSAAEPFISRHPRVLAWLERLDRLVSRPLAVMGDHILYRFTRTVMAP